MLTAQERYLAAWRQCCQMRCACWHMLDHLSPFESSSLHSPKGSFDANRIIPATRDLKWIKGGLWVYPIPFFLILFILKMDARTKPPSVLNLTPGDFKDTSLQFSWYQPGSVLSLLLLRVVFFHLLLAFKSNKISQISLPPTRSRWYGGCICVYISYEYEPEKLARNVQGPFQIKGNLFLLLQNNLAYLVIQEKPALPELWKHIFQYRKPNRERSFCPIQQNKVYYNCK